MTISGKKIKPEQLFKMSDVELDRLYNAHTTCPEDQIEYDDLLNAIEKVFSSR